MFRNDKNRILPAFDNLLSSFCYLNLNLIGVLYNYCLSDFFLLLYCLSSSISGVWLPPLKLHFNKRKKATLLIFNNDYQSNSTLSNTNPLWNTTCVFHVTLDKSYVEDRLYTVLQELSRPGFSANLSRSSISLINIISCWWSPGFSLERGLLLRMFGTHFELLTNGEIFYNG
jgi:hypothetical protein